MKKLFLKIAKWAASHTEDYTVAKKSDIKQKEMLLHVLTRACEMNGNLPPCPICGKPFNYIDHVGRVYELLCGHCHIKKECDFVEIVEMFNQAKNEKDMEKIK